MIQENEFEVKQEEIEIITVDENGKFIDDSQNPPDDLEDSELDNDWKFGNRKKNKVVVNLHLSDLLRFGGLLQIKHVDSKTGEASFRRLERTEVLMIFELFDNFKFHVGKYLGFSPTSQVLLARAADLDPTTVSKKISQILTDPKSNEIKDKFHCPFCGDEFEILRRTPFDVVYMKDGKVQEGRRGYGYILRSIVEFLAHLTAHKNEDEKFFNVKRNSLEVAMKRNVSEKSLKNLEKRNKVTAKVEEAEF